MNDKFQRLKKCQNEMNDLIFKDENAEQLFETDFLSGEKYRDRFTELCAKIDQLATKETLKIVTSQRKFMFPKIDLKKFSGNAKEYLIFWTQIRKIDEDSSIPPEDKFKYLLQAVVPKSKAAQVVVFRPQWITTRMPLHSSKTEVHGEQLIELAPSGIASGSQRKRDTWPKSVLDYGNASMLLSISDCKRRPSICFSKCKCHQKNSLVYVALYHIHHIWHHRVRLRESGQPIGRLRKTCKNAFPRTIPVSFGRLDTSIATESSLNIHF
ncbi:DUF1758 domain-containing protein [Trichonephila clavipes]|nr:DUF1758 domain-containing protein [Trichonephila clavipes]